MLANYKDNFDTGKTTANKSMGLYHTEINLVFLSASILECRINSI